MEFTSCTPWAFSRRAISLDLGGLLLVDSGDSWNHTNQNKPCTERDARWLTSNIQTLILPSAPVEASQPSDSLSLSAFSDFPFPHVTE